MLRALQRVSCVTRAEILFHLALISMRYIPRRLRDVLGSVKVIQGKTRFGYRFLNRAY